MRLLTTPLRSRWTAVLTILLAVVAMGALFAVAAPDVVKKQVASGLPASYQSAEAELRQDALPGPGVAPAVVVYSRVDGSALDGADRAALDAQTPSLAAHAEGGRTAPAQVSSDGTVVVVAVPVSTVDQSAVAATVGEIRAAVAVGLPAGVQAQVTGGPAFTTDLTKVFEGADVRLLLVTLGIVALLLILTYRSPWFWLVPLVVVGGAEQATTRLVALIAPHAGIVADPAAAGITSVLVFGAATDYALLLIARYRTALRDEERTFAAMRTAVRRTFEPIVASAATVVLSLLTLLLADQEYLRAIGFSGAVGVIVAMVSSLIVLPPALALFGRGLFWPFVPRVGDPVREGRVWGRIGAAVAQHPYRVAVGATAMLLVLALGGVGLSVGLSQDEQFRLKPEAVSGQDTLARAFPAGATEPVTIMTTAAAAGVVTAAVADVPGVASVRPGRAHAGTAEVEAVLNAAPGSEQSYDVVRAIRAAIAEVPGAEAVVGGQVATSLDTKDASVRDAKVVIPLVLLVVVLVLVLLLRSLLAPLVLVATVVGTFFAAVGAAWFICAHLLGYPAFDTGVLLLGFLFLVALGVDYNIFLVSRAREEARAVGTHAGMLTALRSTGGVITSAGILLAAVFAVLGVLPLIALAQVGLVVCIGVLLDTLVVRTVLVPSLVFIVGERFWWPGHVHPDRRGAVRAGGGADHELSPGEPAPAA